MHTAYHTEISLSRCWSPKFLRLSSFSYTFQQESYTIRLHGSARNRWHPSKVWQSHFFTLLDRKARFEIRTVLGCGKSPRSILWCMTWRFYPSKLAVKLRHLSSVIIQNPGSGRGDSAEKPSEFRLDGSTEQNEKRGQLILCMPVLAMNWYWYRCAGRKDKDNLHSKKLIPQ